jgi:hypothetical protein
MDTPVSFDVARAHRHFSVECFNRTWTLIDKSGRTSAEDESMLLLASASLWHWTERTDCTNVERSVGHWQVSRVYALIGDGQNALKHGERSLEHAVDLRPFYRGYAHEAIARAAGLLGDPIRLQRHRLMAAEAAADIAEADERSLLENDLKSLE